MGELTRELEDKQRALIRMADDDPGYDTLAAEILALRDQRRGLIEDDANRQSDLIRLELLILSRVLIYIFLDRQMPCKDVAGM